MKEPGEVDRGTTRDGRIGSDAEKDRLDRPEADRASELLAALQGGQMGAETAVRLLASRLMEAEGRLAQLGRSMDRMKRRLGDVESRLAGLENRSSEHGESLRMMCAILEDLDDPYGFGHSLDEQIAYDGPDWTTDEEA